jgi:hypothetical protein
MQSIPVSLPVQATAIIFMDLFPAFFRDVQVQIKKSIRAESPAG